VNAQTRIERSDRWTPWGRLCAPRHAPLRRTAGDTAIHSAWCACDDCAYVAARRALRGDLAVIGFGIIAALAAIAMLALLGIPAK
jgi:hypothetical protein